MAREWAAFATALESRADERPLPLPALDEIRAHEDEMVQIRRQIHADPEMASQEHVTAQRVAERLACWGCEV